jgi:hypothetical protein
MGHNDYAHRQLTRVVSGAVDDAFKHHPDYLTPKGKRSAKGSIVKRVTGTVLSFAVQAARGRVETAVQEPGLATAQAPVSAPLDVGTGDGVLPAPSPARRAIRKDAASYVRAFHETTSRLERFKRVHDLCYAAVAAAILPARKCVGAE